MRIAITFVFALMVLCVVGNSSVSAQPSIAVYFDQINTESEVCLGPNVLDTLYIVAQNVNTFFNAIEYRVDYSPGSAYFTFVGDLNSAGTVVGNSAVGVSLGWGLPHNGFNPVVVQRALVFWTCSGCGPQDFIRVVPNPFTPDPIVAVEFPTNIKIPMIGLTSLICASVPAHETTWGKVKSLYSVQE
jgi:hypothetical protein